jgi:hypothetical protein
MRKKEDFWVRKIQTPLEKTRDPRHIEILTSLLAYYHRNKHLTPRQMQLIYILRYWILDRGKGTKV